MTTEEKAQRYDEISKEVKDFFDGKLMMYSDVKQTLNYLFPELAESEDEKIRKELLESFKYQQRESRTDKEWLNGIKLSEVVAWLEKQGNSSKECLNLPHFTFDDVLALQCCMETVKKVQEDKELYEQLQNLHNRLHDVYWLEKQGDSNNQNWKPSKGQIDALEHFVRSIGESGYASPYDDNTKLLKSLINDLYKLLENQSEQEEPQVYDTGDGDVITYSETAGYNVEPKLKIERGKWYVCIKNLLDDYGNIAFCKGDVYLSEKDGYLIPSNSNVPWMIAYCVDTYFKEWTIKDAKDGDVLAFKNNIGGIIICKSPANYNTRSYCRLVNEHLIKREESGWDSTLLVPTTKEQRDLLFQKMKEDGYEWDAEKKELKMVDWSKHIEYEPNSPSIIEPKQEWSEEDEEMLDEVINNLHNYIFKSDNTYSYIDCDKHITWLKSLEERVQPKPTEWSEDDEEMIDKIIDYMKPMPIFFESTKGKSGKEYTKEFIKNAIKWLKSIKGRIQPQQKWTEEDENGFGETLWAINKARTIAENENDMGNLWYAENWLKSLKERLS